MNLMGELVINKVRLEQIGQTHRMSDLMETLEQMDRVTGDLQHASIFYTVLGDDEQREKAARAFASAQGLFRSRVGKALGLRLTPTLEFILDALPESAAALEDALAKAKAKDEAIAAASAGATYAGDADPYRHDDEEDEADAKDWA